MSLFTIVIPVFNEEEVLNRLVADLYSTINNLQEQHFEVIFVDDGSTDSTPLLLNKIQQSDKRIRIITFTRNFGHQPALIAGLEHATGDAVIILDADLQDPPLLIKEMIKAFDVGYDIVATQKISRDATLLMNLAYSVFYKLQRTVVDGPVLLDSGDFGLLSRRAVNLILSFPERQIFLRGLRSWTGLNQKVIPFERGVRVAGTSKYSFKKLFLLSADGIFAFSVFPLRLMTVMGILTVIISAAYFAYNVVIKIFFSSPIGFTALIGVMFLTSGIQLCFLGVIGEYVARIYTEVKNRPRYVIGETSGFSAEL